MPKTMTAYATISANRRDLDQARLYDGVRTRRMVGFVVDYALVALLTIPAAVVVFLVGIVTLGLGWLLYAILVPLVAIIYVAFTLGGRSQATPGMRFGGVRLERLDGGRIDPAFAVLHAVLFWATATLLTPAVLLFGLVTPRKQLLHDLLLGTVVARLR